MDQKFKIQYGVVKRMKKEYDYYQKEVNVNEDKIFQFENPLKVVGVFTVLITFVSGIFPGIFSYLGEVSSIFFGN